METSPQVVADARVRILDAAAEAFMRSGFSGTTIDDLARDVHATKGLVYYHFKSKFDIFLAVYGEGMRRARARVEPFAAGPGTGRSRIEAMSVAHLLNVMEDLAYHHAVHQAVRGEVSAGLKARQLEALNDLGRLRADYEEMFRAVVAEGIADGSLRRVNLRLAVRTLLSNLNAVDNWYRRIDGQTADDLHHLAVEIVDLLIGGLATNP
ncbi:TetR/AcrR family transcriptional regulator [Catenuloplanes atrovinosus]|uniref:AcrR family transcriptional regulator n=1 Tax=Catenuloplanes atrovinosus TaxID=137266 RepID=A0AAE3YNC6_9ACTN|nr:TetR/AcrR family transcriptional regulator [Catenuloplanes atrovinosus]MDR7275551.1 AcrR family transcriptional regulator [Catenuloplanes atrovinosus]